MERLMAPILVALTPETSFADGFAKQGFQAGL